MESSETMLNRRSIRKYNGKEVSENDLKSILQAGLLAPSSRNLHPVEMVVVRDRSMLDSLLTRPSNLKYPGFGFWKDKTGWKARPHKDSILSMPNGTYGGVRGRKKIRPTRLKGIFNNEICICIENRSC